MAKAKGTTLLSLVKFLRTRADEARRHLDPGLHGYLSEKIESSAWYPEEDLVGLIRCMLALVPDDRDEALANMGRVVAQEHLEGVYGHLRVDVHDPRTLGVRSFALWSTMHDSGDLRIEEVRDGEATFELHAYAHPSEEMCKIVCAYFIESMRLAGGAAAEGEEISCRRDGADACRVRVRWRPVGV
jgi:hypothetical protein